MHGRKAGNAVFVQKGSTLKVMEEFNIQGKETFLFKYCPGTFGYILVLPGLIRTKLDVVLKYNIDSFNFLCLSVLLKTQFSLPSKHSDRTARP